MKLPALSLCSTKLKHKHTMKTQQYYPAFLKGCLPETEKYFNTGAFGTTVPLELFNASFEELFDFGYNELRKWSGIYGTRKPLTNFLTPEQLRRLYKLDKLYTQLLDIVQPSNATELSNVCENVLAGQRSAITARKEKDIEEARERLEAMFTK